MRIYIAAPWVRKAEAIAVGEQFKAAGHIVTSNWFHHEDTGALGDSAGNSITHEERKRQATVDLADVLSSDALVVLNLEKSEGKAVETGIALVAGLKVISVGPRSNIFQSLAIEVATVEEALALLVNS